MRTGTTPLDIIDRAEQLRAEVRAFLTEELADVSPVERSKSWTRFDPAFTRKVAERGWLGMTWPKRYGGQERSAFERYVVIEEMLAAGAPVGAHWVGDRQSGPTLLKFGSPDQQAAILPRIVAGEAFFCIGMSEPGAGSDLAATRTRAVRTPEGWRITGTKVWTTFAHLCDYMILFCRTSGTVSDRQKGTSQLLIDLKRTPKLTISPIRDLNGDHHFNEVHFDGSLVPADALIGEEGAGWQQVMSELELERSGPERFLSTIQTLTELIEMFRDDNDDVARQAVGTLVSHLIVLRRLSRGVAATIEAGEETGLQAAIVKDLGAVFEQLVPETARRLVEDEPDLSSPRPISAVLAHALVTAPGVSLRGGTREILRGIIGRGLSLR